MSDEATGKSGKTWFCAVGWLASLFVVYVLSIGPVFVLAARRTLPVEVLHAYTPVVWVVAATGTGDAWRAYLRIWCQTTQTRVPGIF